MSQPVRSTSWSRGSHDSAGAGSFRSSGSRVRPSRFRSNRSFRDPLFPGPRPSSGASIPSEFKPREPSDAALTARAADAQTSLTLNSTLVDTAFTRDGAGSGTITASLTSSNNFINFCATVNTAITNGKQLETGSCNPAPMGLIPSSTNMPSVLIDDSIKGNTFKAETTIPVNLFVANLQSGAVVNFTGNFLAAPQQLNSAGEIIGHYNIVVDELNALDSTTPTDSQQFSFFRTVKDVAASGVISSEVTDGLPEGFYRMTVTTHAANGQPALVPVAQHGSLSDVAYFTVTADGTAGSTPGVRRRVPRNLYKSPPPTARSVVLRADDPSQSSLTLLSSLVADGFQNDGQSPPVAGQSASATSSNNFINFCATSTLPLNNGTQTKTGYCNPAPMGVLPAATRMPTSKFTYPRNTDIIRTNAPFTIGLAVKNLATGNFANGQTSYLTAPQQLDSSGQIQGHPLIVIEQLPAGADAFTPPDTTNFVFFKGLSGVADSTGPVLLPVLQHGAVDDAIYFVVADSGALPTNQTALPGSTTSASASAKASSPTGIASSSASPTPVKHKANIAAAVGGAIAGIVLIGLAIFAFWLIMRRRTKPVPTYLGLPAPTPFYGGVSGEGSSMSQLRSSPPVSGSKNSRGPPSSARRSSTASAAPSYHTQI
ncbi:hypothetical protein C8R47DRAFT_1171446 [Mycena vitilis]|nr:hypothetical protein C8R47DRAFT_1171446 [Mycena vitilis]